MRVQGESVQNSGYLKVVLPNSTVELLSPERKFGRIRSGYVWIETPRPYWRDSAWHTVLI